MRNPGGFRCFQRSDCRSARADADVLGEAGLPGVVEGLAHLAHAVERRAVLADGERLAQMHQRRPILDLGLLDARLVLAVEAAESVLVDAVEGHALLVGGELADIQGGGDRQAVELVLARTLLLVGVEAPSKDRGDLALVLGDDGRGRHEAGDRDIAGIQVRMQNGTHDFLLCCASSKMDSGTILEQTYIVNTYAKRRAEGVLVERMKSIAMETSATTPTATAIWTINFVPAIAATINVAVLGRPP